MRAPRRLTIRFRLGLALALALLPVLLLGALGTYRSFRHDVDGRRVALSIAAARSATGARTRVQGATALLEALSPDIVGLQCAERLQSVLGRLGGYENLIRLDPIGRVRCAADSVGADAGRRFEPWFVRLRDGAPLVIAEAPAGAFSRHAAVLAAVRGGGSGADFQGAMLAVIALDSLRPDMSDPALPRGTEVELLDGDGRPLMRTRPGAFAPPPPGWRARAGRPSGLIYAGRGQDGIARLHAVSPLVDGEVYAVLSAPSPGLLFFARLYPFSSIFLPLLAWGLAWTAVWFITERVVIRWLAYLERIAAIYARGRFTVRPIQARSAPAEIRALAETLDAMAEGLVARDRSLQESLAQKDAMMREIHHRVKNNLQVITSLLNMQQRSLADPAARAAMADTRQRISALALIYRALYQSPDLRRVDVRQFLEELTAQLTAGEGGVTKVRTELDADDLEIDPDKLAPLALFAVEAITNARKHAFDETGGLIQVRFRVGAERVELTISDDGRGDAQPEGATGVGRTLMTAFARQLRGECEVGPGATCGVVVRLSFPRPDPEPGDIAPKTFVLSGNRAAA